MRVSKITSTTIAAATFCLPGQTLAQTSGTYLIKSSSVVSPTSPTTTIEVWATWVEESPSYFHAFVYGKYDMTAGDGLFSNPVLFLGSPLGGATPGVATGNVVTGALVYQIHVLPSHGGSMENPILLATYDWTATSFTPRTVHLNTSNTTEFNVSAGGLYINLYPHEFTPGAGVITVVPAPAAWLALGLPLAIVRRRRT